MKDKIILFEWTYEPPDYFESKILIKQDAYELTIENGKAEARLKFVHRDEEYRIREELHKSLNSRFLGVQLLTYKPYQLSKPSTYHLHPDGKRDVFIQVNSAVITVTGNPVDLIVRDRDGNIVTDTKNERIKEKKALAELTERFAKNPIVLALLQSHKNAITDPKNELIHLYEICDTLKSTFKSINNACSTLGISKKQEWGRLGKLANDEPLTQGRHRGQNAGNLRDATNAELNEARQIARKMVHAYLLYLDKTNGQK